ncbi:unnamed protein product [Parnassius mnemosyne]|uniref:RNA-directed DNA polymerase n=1 Tax=Parnassius mnemosyne TaxID=213953 RepID=A0AAV1KHV7_9NEOP
MPYVLSNAPVFYQNIISKTLKSFFDSGKVLVYIDDVLLLSDTILEGLALLRRVLETLTSSGFSVNLKKCTFLISEIEYLGRVISNGQVRPSIRNFQALVDSPKLRSVKQVQQFLGLACYFRRYIPNYAQQTACIVLLTKKNMPFEWGVEQDKARQYIIDRLTNKPVLAIYDPQLPTEVHTDTSAIGYGAVLIQIHEGGLRRAVAYLSKSTQGAEPKYHSYELETLAVVKALQNFRKYLLGVSFKIVTDCNALKLTERKKDLLPHVARWWLSMRDFQYTFEYRKGSLMSHADYLSRNPVEVCHIQNPKNWTKLAQSADEETLNLIDEFNNGQLDSSRYELRNGLLYVKYFPIGEESRLLCYIPKGFRLSLLHVFHDDQDHIGYDKTIELILRYFWFPGLLPFVRKYLKHCIVSLSHKRMPRAPHQPIESWTKPDVPFSVVHMDTLGLLPESQDYKHVLLIIDAFTKY